MQKDFFVGVSFSNYGVFYAGEKFSVSIKVARGMSHTHLNMSSSSDYYKSQHPLVSPLSQKMIKAQMEETEEKVSALDIQRNNKGNSTIFSWLWQIVPSISTQEEEGKNIDEVLEAAKLESLALNEATRVVLEGNSHVERRFSNGSVGDDTESISEALSVQNGSRRSSITVSRAASFSSSAGSKKEIALGFGMIVGYFTVDPTIITLTPKLNSLKDFFFSRDGGGVCVDEVYKKLKENNAIPIFITMPNILFGNLKVEASGKRICNYLCLPS
jgi:hypothetical protein